MPKIIKHYFVSYTVKSLKVTILSGQNYSCIYIVKSLKDILYKDQMTTKKCFNLKINHMKVKVYAIDIPKRKSNGSKIKFSTLFKKKIHFTKV